MNLFLGWPEITIRLLSTAAAGSLIGFNRGEHGRPVGLRTTILASLAACIAMILANLLLRTLGGPDEREIQDGLRADGYQILSCATNDNIVHNRRRITYILQWRSPITDLSSPNSLRNLANDPEVVRIVWTPEGD